MIDVSSLSKLSMFCVPGVQTNKMRYYLSLVPNGRVGRQFKAEFSHYITIQPLAVPWYFCFLQYQDTFGKSSLALSHYTINNTKALMSISATTEKEEKTQC